MRPVDAMGSTSRLVPTAFESGSLTTHLTMDAYPNHWRWSNSITSSQARVLLPLAWLVRVKDNAEARSWLHRVAQDLLAHQHESGAIFEWTGPAGTGIQMPPTSNEKYGTGEGTLTQQNGDPVADLLYTMNFAFIGFHEAHAATGWGAWCTEAGWSQSWISSTFALRLLKRSLWEVVSEKPAYSKFDELRERMFP